MDSGICSKSSPRPWGCFYKSSLKKEALKVFPTPVGVFLINWKLLQRRLCLPHARGGVSHGERRNAQGKKSSPRPWGCFPSTMLAAEQARVFPTPVGVFPPINRLDVTKYSLPHARGGVSASFIQEGDAVTSSPRPWGCFSASIPCSHLVNVFPTPVGVFLYDLRHTAASYRLPHARGGVSFLWDKDCPIEKSSPRPWGCFLLQGAD